MNEQHQMMCNKLVLRKNTPIEISVNVRTERCIRWVFDLSWSRKVRVTSNIRGCLRGISYGRHLSSAYRTFDSNTSVQRNTTKKPECDLTETDQHFYQPFCLLFSGRLLGWLIRYLTCLRNLYSSNACGFISLSNVSMKDAINLSDHASA